MNRKQNSPAQDLGRQSIQAMEGAPAAFFAKEDREWRRGLGWAGGFLTVFFDQVIFQGLARAMGKRA